MKAKTRSLILVTTFLGMINQAEIRAAILDTGFDPGSGANGTISAIAIDGDKILIGGYFTSYNGTAVTNIARLYSNGSLDTGFHGYSQEGVETIALQQIGSFPYILIGGQFTTIRRLNNDGTVDTSFSQPTLNHYVNSITPGYTTGKFIIGGEFTNINSYTRNRVARLNSDGSLDTSFDPSYGANGTVYSVSLDTDGKVLVGGAFTILGSQGPYPSHSYIGRLLSTGGIDTGFSSSANGTVYDVRFALNAGSYAALAGGTFTTLSSSSRDRYGLLNSSGSVYSGWTYAGADATVWAVATQDNNYYLIGGSFTNVNNAQHRGIARVGVSDGAPDSNWNTANNGITGGSVYAIAVLGDGDILIAGSFTAVEGTSRNRIARLNP